MEINNKHLVRVGHEFAAAMSDDTPIITIAKMVTALASALDVQTALSEALAAERDAVNADNVYLRDQVLCWARECDRITYTHTNKITDAHQSEAEQELANTVPATDAFLAEVRAQGVEMFAAYQRSLSAGWACKDGKDPLGKIAEDAERFADQLRGEKTA